LTWNNKENIVKKDAKCMCRSMWKYCYYWRAKKSIINGQVIGYFCDLYNKDKVGYASLSECNKKYGRTYDGRKK
jgi:hypothetical protein